MSHKKYRDIDVFRASFADGFKKGDRIVIQEKMDGANASFDDQLASFSRRQVLDSDNHLQGFYQYVKAFDKSRFDTTKTKNLRFFGEWMRKHKIAYPESVLGNFFMFDIYDMHNEKYLPQEEVVAFAAQLGLRMVPTFYDGEFISWEHIMSFLGKSAFVECGEGIVVKNMTRLNDPNTRLPHYVKIVTPEFQERMKNQVKEPVNPEVLARMEYEQELVDSIVTKARVRKQLFILVEDGVLAEGFGMEDMGIIARNLGRMLYEDCAKEEREIVDKVGARFGKLCAAAGIKLAKEIIAES